MSDYTYKNSGVNIDKANDLIVKISKVAKQTHTKGVISGIGLFASLFELDLKKYPNPIIVSGTDGVGTKLAIAHALNNYTTIGQDLVAMCVNDVLTTGAKPLFFLDYFATGVLDNDQATSVITSIAHACKSVDCALVGGETAEMPGFYKPGEFDIAGFAVGVVDKSKIINGQNIGFGDYIVALPSSGLHSNGYSLVRKIIKEKLNNDFSTKVYNETKNLGEILLTPTRLYVNEILELSKDIQIKGLAHITGGGLIENIPRILPDGLAADIDTSKINLPPIFRFLKEKGNLSDSEMFQTFNCGIGMVIICNQNNASRILNTIDSEIIGTISQA